MIICNNCGTVYYNDATYCNRCKNDLSLQNSSNLVDQEKYIAQQQILRDNKRIITTILFVVGLLFPFVVIFDLVFYISAVIHKTLIITIIEFGVLTCVASINRNWHKSKLLCGVLSVLLLVLFPVGTVLGIVLIYQIVKRDW